MLAKFGTDSGGITWCSNLEQMQVAFYLAGAIAQVIDSIPWVRCASGNVSMFGDNSGENLRKERKMYENYWQRQLVTVCPRSSESLLINLN